MTIKSVLEELFKNDILLLKPPLVDKNTVVYEKEVLERWIPQALAAIKKEVEGVMPECKHEGEQMNFHCPTCAFRAEMKRRVEQWES